MTIKDLLIMNGWYYMSNRDDDLGDYVYLQKRYDTYRRYYYQKGLLTDGLDRVVAHNPSIKLLWLMGLIT